MMEDLFAQTGYPFEWGRKHRSEVKESILSFCRCQFRDIAVLSIEDAGKKEIKTYRGWRGPEGEVHVLWGDVLAVPKGARHPNKAVRLMELLISIETQKTLVARLLWPPARLDAYDVPPEIAPYFKAVREALSYAEVRPTVPLWTLVEGVLDSAFGGLVREGKDIALLPEYSTALKNIPSRYLRYPVQTGDTLEAIADRYNTTKDILAVANCTTIRAPVWPGQILLIPQQ